MSLEIAQIVVAMFEGYALVGLGFALTFLPRAVARLDHGIQGSPLTMRLLILPGVVAFWPLFAWRWLGGMSAPTERNAHRGVAGPL